MNDRFSGNTPQQSTSTRTGLYDPEWEHDACGVGFVAHIKGQKSHDIVRMGLTILDNLVHRGAHGCDPNTGDGAGILLQIPDVFLRRECQTIGCDLPPVGFYGVGMAFLPQADHARALCEEIVERTVRREGQRFLGWRTVPTDGTKIGELARESEPIVKQFFVGRGPLVGDEAAFERKLIVIRKVVEAEVREATGIPDPDSFYIPSLSSRTIIYKGLLLPHQMRGFYPDLVDEDVISAIALVHQRFSTNTFPSWPLAHPYRFLAHNGEINTIRGNRNWMSAREAALSSSVLGKDLPKLFPLVSQHGSDSATLDNAVELMLAGGHSLAHTLMTLIPEAWSENAQMEPAQRAFYEYQACVMEPWDGPAAVAFTDGVQIGAVLDRNGLRPARYTVTNDDLVVLASETGVIPFPPETIKEKGRLQPGKMFLVDTNEGRIVSDDEIKAVVCGQHPYGPWLEKNRVDLSDLPTPEPVDRSDHQTIVARQKAFGYTSEDIRLLLTPMAIGGEEALGSMGTDTPLSVLSHRPQPLYSYFKQLFAQVTNPPIDPIRESLVMSLAGYIGKSGSLLDETPENARQVRLPTPILTNDDLEKLRRLSETETHEDFRYAELPMHFPVGKPFGQMARELTRLCWKASEYIERGCALLILTDRNVGQDSAPIPSLLAVSAVHHHLIRQGTRTSVALVVESGDAREVHHFACLLGYGASAVNPYLAFETFDDLHRQGYFPSEITPEKAGKNLVKAVNKGLLKVMSKMGISTMQSYRAAQIFEAVGLSSRLIDDYFAGTPTRIEGVGMDELEREARQLHSEAYPEAHLNGSLELEPGGQYQWRRFGEYHAFNPETISLLQKAVRTDSFETFGEFSEAVNAESERAATLRGLMTLVPRASGPVPLAQVEPAREIVKRFSTGAMSLGSISRESHEGLALAMNQIGGKSNTGEGGEDAARFGTDRRSKIKQVASGRFGVTTEYLVSADELQIKMAQGAKPGEGGQLMGHKVDDYIGQIRRATPGVTLISPPPHHDIYSIEDLAQLIFDLKNVNPRARISVKLVAEVGVGTVAAGVAKAHADHILIAGYEGGTGASPLSSIKHAGIPWELGLAETQQVLVKNNLRGKVKLAADGQMKTGRDVVVAALLGAEEFGFSTAPLVAQGCIMMRVCHLGTCPVGIATQDPILRKRFAGQPEHVVNYFFFVAEEVRQIMAQLGFRTLDEMIGQTQQLNPSHAVRHWKARNLDLSRLLEGTQSEPANIPVRYCEPQNHGLDGALDYQLIETAKPALEDGKEICFTLPIHNYNRSCGAMLSGEIASRFGDKGLPDSTISIHFTGAAGQSFGAFLAAGLSLHLEGDANDYLGKGMSGGRIVVVPPRGSAFKPGENVIAGNTLLYGATGGEAYLRGTVGERFAVRNSGAKTVVEGVGDHGCEYMTGGTVVVLGKTGRNFAAGMSGGVAYVYDANGVFADESVSPNNNLVCEQVWPGSGDETDLLALVTAHHERTGSDTAQNLLADWESERAKFVKVIASQYRQLLEARKQANGERLEAQTGRYIPTFAPLMMAAKG